MPYFIQMAHDFWQRVETVQKKHEDREKKEEKQAKQQMNQPIEMVNDLLMPGIYNSMLMPPPILNNMPNMPNMPSNGPNIFQSSPNFPMGNNMPFGGGN